MTERQRDVAARIEAARDQALDERARRLLAKPWAGMNERQRNANARQFQRVQSEIDKRAEARKAGTS